MDKYTKGIISILTISMLFVSVAPLMTSAFEEPPGADPDEWYMTVNGVLSTDTYELYPYEKKDLTIGFSQFGEMIDTLTNIGLQYGTEDEPGRDPFAPIYGADTVSVLPKYVWLEGWLINITYWKGSRLRNVWATAQHADIDSWQYGNDWVRIDDDYPTLSPASESDEIPYNGYYGYFIGSSPEVYGTGGRVTNGTVVTEPIEVLYDGPRRFVARIVNHISDWMQTPGTLTGESIHIIDLIITIDFNKVKKEVQLLKDVKLIPIKGGYGMIPPSYFLGPIPDGYKIEKIGDITKLFKWDESLGFWFGWDSYNDDWLTHLYPRSDWNVTLPIDEPVSAVFVQFSNRGQWDLGTSPDYASYVHFYTEGDWDYDSRDAGFDYYPFWWMPDKTVIDPETEDDVITEGLFTVYGNEYTSTSTAPPNYYTRHGSEPWPPVSDDWADPSTGSTFDVAQIISDDEKYVGWAAYWPSLSDWSVAGIDLYQYWKSLGSYDLHPIDWVGGEPWMSPYLIGEWDFFLARTSMTINAHLPEDIDGTYPVKVDKQFRGVTVYGLTDLHTDVFGDDYAWEDYDYEWCDYGYVPEDWWYYHYRSDWDGEWYEDLWPLERESWGRWTTFTWGYEWLDNPPVGAGTDDNMDGMAEFEPWENVIDREVAYQLYEKFRPWDLMKASEKDSSRWVEFGLGLADEDEWEIWPEWGSPFGEDETYDYIFLEVTSAWEFYTHQWHPDDYILGWKYYGDEQSSHEIGEWYAYCTFPERVLVELDPEDHPGELTLLVRGVDYLIISESDTWAYDMYVVFIDGGEPWKPLEIPEGALIKVLYSTWGPGLYATEAPAEELFSDYRYYGGGTYEWITAGRDAASVDSLGASIVTEAFDSLKDIAVRWPSLDMQDTQFAPTVPFLLRKFGAGDTRADYYYDYPDDFRLALKDDWSSTVPISSSNIITVGGPLANAVTEYFNEFEEAVYRGGVGAAEPMNDFLLVPDWGSTFMGHDTLDTTIPGVVEDDFGLSGIGIVSTYKDINGTVGLVVYGYSGEDTVWISKLFYQFNMPIFLDDGDGVLDWTDDNDNGILDPGDLTLDAKLCPKLGITVPGWWAGDDLMIGMVYEDYNGDLKWMFWPLLYMLQEENPGVTELVIKIYYEIPNSMNPYVVDTGELFSTDVHPVFLIVEELGTISEKPRHPDP